MRTVFKIASFDTEGKLTLLPNEEHETYAAAEDQIVNHLPAGTYQVQKVFIKP